MTHNSFQDEVNILMAHLWMQDVNGWGARKLDAALYDLAATPIPHAGEVPMGLSALNPYPVTGSVRDR